MLITDKRDSLKQSRDFPNYKLWRNKVVRMLKEAKADYYINLIVTCALQARFKLNKDPTSAIRKCNLSSLLQKIICVRNNMCPLI